MTRIWFGVLLALLSSISVASPADESRLTIGVLRLGSDKAFAKLEKRLERWLQDQAEFPLVTFSFSASPDDGDRESCWQLNARADRILKSPEVSSWTAKRSALQIKDLNSHIRKAGSNPLLGLCRQRALLARALLEEQAGADAASRATIGEALRAARTLPADLEWDWETQENVRPNFAVKISEASASLAAISKKAAVESQSVSDKDPAVFLLVDRTGDLFQLYLYFPFRAPIPVAWTRPLTQSEVLTSPARSTLPLDGGTFFRKLRQESFGEESVSLRPLPSKGAEEPLSNLRSELPEKPAPEEPSKWYNKQSFWVVVGGVAAGAALLHVLTGNQDGNPESTRGLSVQVR